MSDPLKDALARGDTFRRQAVDDIDRKVTRASEKLGWPKKLAYGFVAAALLLALWLVTLAIG